MCALSPYFPNIRSIQNFLVAIDSKYISDCFIDSPRLVLINKICRSFDDSVSNLVTHNFERGQIDVIAEPKICISYPVILDPVGIYLGDSEDLYLRAISIKTRSPVLSFK